MSTTISTISATSSPSIGQRIIRGRWIGKIFIIVLAGLAILKFAQGFAESPTLFWQMTSNFRALADVDRVINEPARTMIVAILYNLESADFLYLQRETGLTKGNLPAHLSKLEEAGYVQIEKTFKGKLPLTVCKLTSTGQKAHKSYRQQLQDFMNKTG